MHKNSNVKCRNQHTRARQRILDALDEVVAQLTVQADCFQRRDAAAPIIVTSEVVGWVSSIALALVRYGEGEYQTAAALASIADPTREGSGQ